MLVEKQVVVVDRTAFAHPDRAVVDQVLGRDQHLVLAEQKFGHVVAHQDPMLRRQNQRFMKAHGAAFDHDRGESAGCFHVPMADPANGLQAVVAGLDHVTDAQVLNRDLAPVGADAGALGKAGDRGDGDEGRVGNAGPAPCCRGVGEGEVFGRGGQAVACGRLDQ